MIKDRGFEDCTNKNPGAAINRQEESTDSTDGVAFESPKYFGYARVRDNYLRSALSSKKQTNFK